MCKMMIQLHRMASKKYVINPARNREALLQATDYSNFPERSRNGIGVLFKQPEYVWLRVFILPCLERGELFAR